MNLPITSRMKRSPLMQTSEEDKKKKKTPPKPLRKLKDPVTVPTYTSGGDKYNITVEKGSNYHKAGGTMGGLRPVGPFNTKEEDFMWEGHSAPKSAPNKKTSTPFKGKGVDYDGTAKIETKGDVLHSHEIRDLSRGTKKVTKDVTDTKRKIDKTSRRQQKMIDKYDTVDPKTGKKDGKISDEERSKMSTGFLGFGNKQAKYDRLKRRSEENTSRLEINKAAVEHNKITRASGKRAGTSDVRTGERDMSMSELESNLGSVKIQEAHLKKKAAAESQKITTSSTKGSQSDSDKAVAGYAGQAANAPKVGTTTVTPNYNYGKFGRYPYRMKGSMFNKK